MVRIDREELSTKIQMTLQDVCVYADPEERNEIFEYLDGLEVEYHKQYKRFNKIVKVPRGQASYTLNEDIHYDYKVSGGVVLRQTQS